MRRRTTEPARMPWEEDQVFQLPERDGWVYWAVGLNGAGVANVASQVPGGANNPMVLEAVRALDEDAMADGEAWGAGLWLPASAGHRARAGVLVRTYPDRGDVDRAYRRFARQARKAPRIPGVTISSYDVGEGEVDLGRFVLQVIDTAGADRQLQLRWRYTIFSPAKDEVVVVEFQTVHAELVDAIEDELAYLIPRAFYRVPEGWVD